MSYYDRKSRYDSFVIFCLCVALVVSLLMWAGIVWVVEQLWDTVQSVVVVNQAQAEQIRFLMEVNVAQNDYLLRGK